jgi:DNA phosphorothioation-dependent restriction protein DptH
MATIFKAISDQDFNDALSENIYPRLAEMLTSRGDGHCARVSDLSLDFVTVLAKRLRKDVSHAQVYILIDGAFQKPADDNDVFISSSKVIELRNPYPNGTLRPPLLVFIPPNLHVSAEDSFSIATFEEIDLSNIYSDLIDNLIKRLPISLQSIITEIFSDEDLSKWPWANTVARAKFLISSINNDIDSESLGASLFELGLIPDFKVFQNPEIARSRIKKNLQISNKLTYSDLTMRGRVLELGLVDRSTCRRVIDLLILFGSAEPSNWQRQIVLNNSNWDISFDKWKFIDETYKEKINIHSVTIDLPIAQDENNPHFQHILGQQYLIPEERKKANVEFEVEPHPLQIRGLDHFTVQVFSKAPDTGLSVFTGISKKQKVWKSKKNSAIVSIDKLNKYSLDAGWFFIRVLPWTEDDDPIPLEDNPDDAQRAYESDLFYVLPDEEAEETPPQRAMPIGDSLEHARIKIQLQAIGEKRNPAEVIPQYVGWSEKSSKKAHISHDTLVARFGKFGTYQILVPRPLRNIERLLIEKADSLGRWEWTIDKGVVVDPRYIPIELPRSNALNLFLSARKKYLHAIDAENGLISQAANFLDLRELVFEYAQAYFDLLNDQKVKISRLTGAEQLAAIGVLRSILSIENVHVTISDYSTITKNAILVGPIHPLRALWYSTWAAVAQEWIKETNSKYSSLIREALLDQLGILHMPLGVPSPTGRVFTSVENINPFWTLYAVSSEKDARSLVGDICSVLGLPEPSIGGNSVTPEMLSVRVQKYLFQHPYVKNIKINVFNPGSGILLSDLLLSLQKQKEWASLRYDVRLFVSDPSALGIGDSLQDLISPKSGITKEEVDAFSRPSGNHLFPKLSIAVLGIDDFYQQPANYASHITLLLDLFPSSELGISKPAQHERDTAPLYGLVQDFVIDYQDDEEKGIFWKRRPRHGDAHPIEQNKKLTGLLAQLPEILSWGIATIATDTNAGEQLPTFTLGLDANKRELIHQVHEISDWVITIDRNMGIEFYDHGGKRDRPSYLIDYTPTISSSFGHRLVVTTRALSEIEALVSPSLKELGIYAQGQQAAIILNQLRSLSGRLVLKLVSSSSQQSEAIGLALASLFLHYQKALDYQFIVPIDDWMNLFHDAKKQADLLGELLSIKRTDLALFSIDSINRTINCNLIEVKCYQQISSQQSLADDINGQIDRTIDVLRDNFDPSLSFPDRPDRLLRTRELSIVLEFYLGRAERYATLLSEAIKSYRQFLTNLEDGYKLTFTKTAFAFDFGSTGIELFNTEELEFYRIGSDIIRDLFSFGKQDDTIDGSIVPVSIPKYSSGNFLVKKPSECALQPLEKEDDQGEYVPEALHFGDDLADKKPETISQEAKSDIASLHQDLVSPKAAKQIAYDFLLGAASNSPQLGIIGEIGNKKVALDLNQTHTISLFGVQGSGKSYTLGNIIELACMPIQNLNILPNPLATVVFHFSTTEEYRPEFTSMAQANTVKEQIELLRERYGCNPQKVEDIIVMTPKAKLVQRQAETPEIRVLPIAFSSSELRTSDWKFLMGAVGSQSLYLRQVNLIMRKLRDNLTLESILHEVEDSGLSDHLKELARTRLKFAAEYVDDKANLTDLIRPGRLIIVDLRDELIEKDEALGLFVVMLQIFSEAKFSGASFNKLIVFDEAHKYIENQDLVTGLIEVVREMRHKGTSILVASQEPRSVPISLIELSTEIILHRFNSPEWLKHIQKANTALANLNPEKMSALQPGEAFVWSSRASDERFTREAVKFKTRPRVTFHGGATKTAVND